MMRQSGFTLIELLIAVAVIGILAAIAYPSYTAYVARGYRVEAQAELMALAQRLEQHYSNVGNFAGVGCETATPCPVGNSGMYVISHDASGALGNYLISASATNRYIQSWGPLCRQMTINQTGIHGAASDPVNECW